MLRAAFTTECAMVSNSLSGMSAFEPLTPTAAMASPEKSKMGAARQRWFASDSSQSTAHPRRRTPCRYFKNSCLFVMVLAVCASNVNP